jgi:hypothetical protein
MNFIKITLYCLILAALSCQPKTYPANTELSKEQQLKYTVPCIKTLLKDRSQNCRQPYYVDNSLEFHWGFPPLHSYFPNPNILMDESLFKFYSIRNQGIENECIKLYPNIINYLCDTVNISIFSPMLKSKQPNQYIMREYSITGDFIEIRFLSVCDWTYKFEGDSMRLLTPRDTSIGVYNYSQYNFLPLKWTN